MKRFTWWRMEQDPHHLSRALCAAFCSILHHVKRFMSQPPIGFGSRLVKIREWQWTLRLRTYQRATTPFLTFRVYLTADREIFLSQDGWAYELFQGPLRLKGDAHFDPWPGRSRQNHTSLQIASKYIRLPAFSEFNGIGIIFFRK